MSITEAYKLDCAACSHTVEIPKSVSGAGYQATVTGFDRLLSGFPFRVSSTSEATVREG